MPSVGVSGADTGFPEGVGVGEDIHNPPPLDIARVTSSALRKNLDIHKHTHPWTFQLRGGGGGSALSRTLCIGFQNQD